MQKWLPKMLSKSTTAFTVASGTLFLPKDSIYQGTDYLKSSWEGGTRKYIAYIRISWVPLKNAFEGLRHVLGKFKTYDTNFEIRNCTGNSRGISDICLGVMTHFAKEFFIHGCQLTFKELASIMCGACIMSESFKKSNFYNLSENVFTDRDPYQWERIKYYLDRIKVSKTPFKIFDLRGCNFSLTEKETFMQVADSLNLLI